MKLNPAPYHRYSQIGQHIPLLMAFCKKTEDGYTQTHYPVLCRDFFGELLLAKHYKKTYSIYSFTSDKQTSNFDNVLSLTFPSQKILDNFKENFPLIIHPIEAKHQLTLSYTQSESEMDQEFVAWWKMLSVRSNFLITSKQYLSLEAQLEDNFLQD